MGLIKSKMARLLSVPEAAAELGVSERTVWRYLSAGSLERVRERRAKTLRLQTRITTESLRDFTDEAA